jgi:AraC-like DNA-binding protein
MSDFFHLKSISELHHSFGLDKPSHPLITIIKEWPQTDFDFANTKITSDFYVLGMKGNTGGTFQYGRNSYDYEGGTLVFMAPNQVAQFENTDDEKDEDGWSIFFHPDLIRKSQLGKTINDYAFFNYGLNEALHLSDKEKYMLTDLVQRIETELNQNLDKHSQELILANLESVLKYCHRYYDRQFYTRTNHNKDIIVRFEEFIEAYFSSEQLVNKGLPNVTECGKALNMSGSYLSDLLKLETGRSAKDHIHSHLIEKAKTRLLNTGVSVSEVAYSLGFEYPQHFSKLFKSKTGMSPSQYLSSN